MTRKGRALTLSVSEQEKAQLEQLALDFGQTWGENPNVSKLVKAIAKGELRLAANHGWSRDRIDALNLARTHFIDAGRLSEALTIADLILERSELSQPLRQEVQAFVERPSVPWRVDIEQCIRRQRPFRLAYQDAAGRIWNFTVRHAKIVTYEERQYLDCWCDETEGNTDIPELIHNWGLRLDRIPEEAVISPASGHWQPELAYIDVEIHLLNRLAFAYRSKQGFDISNEWNANLQVRQVIRRIHHTFWFFREVLPYGADCVVVSPKHVRQRFGQEVASMMQNYEGI